MECTRRGFLASASLSALAAGSVLGQTPSSGPADQSGPNTMGTAVDWPGPFAERLRTLQAKTGLKIARIETFTQGTALSIVRIRTDDGTEGYGQIAPSEADLSATVLHRMVARHVLGSDPGDFEAISNRVIEANYKFPWSFVSRALGGVDTAIWDLLGRRAGKSVCALLGGVPRPIPVYGSSMSRTIIPEDEAARLVRLRDGQGFRAFKIRVGKRCGHDQDEWPGRTEALVPTVRTAVGDHVDLLADANSCYTPPKAIEVGRLLESHGYCHFEEPCPYWELEWTAKVAAALKIPVAGGEQDNDLAQWRRMLRMKAVDIAQPDVCYVGGFTRALHVAALAHSAGLPCVPHSSNLSMVMVFTLHLLGVISNMGRHAEFTIESNPWGDLYRPGLEVRDGQVAVPDGPGWGVTINAEWLAKAQYQESKLGG
jgi:L-alanine-DL-glutamate epimerase-like enolase superfamily enzyme